MLESFENGQENMLEHACRSARLGSWRLERHTNTLVLSATFCQLLKRDEQEGASLSVDSFIAQHVHPEDGWYVREYQRSPQHQKYSFRAICVDGSQRWLEAFPAFHVEQMNMVTGVVQDITERMATEDGLQNARKMESIRSIAGGIAHEFNNIFYSMAGYLGLMKEILGGEEPLDLEEMREFVGELATSHGRAVQLIKKIQTFSHSGRHGISQVSLNGTVNRALRNIAFPPQIQWHLLQETDDSICVYANAAALEESVSNIVSNGISAMGGEEGTLHIELNTVFETENRPAVCGSIKTGYYGCVSVRDSGCGMDRNTISRIFEPFFTTRQPGRGTGLGLAIVYGAVNAAGGAVEVESQPGKGSHFRLFFPLCTALPKEKPKDDAHTCN